MRMSSYQPREKKTFWHHSWTLKFRKASQRAWVFLVSNSVLLLACRGHLGAADSNVGPAALSGSSNPLVSAVQGEAMTPQEAEKAFNRVVRATPGSPGTWRRIYLQPLPDAQPTNGNERLAAGTNLVPKDWTAVTNTTYEWRLPDGRRFTRKEELERDQSGRLTTRLYVSNDEGYWALHKHIAILYPKSSSARTPGAIEAPEDQPEYASGTINISPSGF